MQRRSTRHWTRRLADGRIEFYMRPDRGPALKGATTLGTYLVLRQMFEGSVRRMPTPERRK